MNCPAVAQILADAGRGQKAVMATIECGKEDDGHKVHACIVNNSKPTIHITWSDEDE